MKIKWAAKGSEGKHFSEPEKEHSSGKFVIVLSDHVLHCLASSLSNVVRQIDSQVDRLVGRQAVENFSWGNF